MSRIDVKPPADTMIAEARAEIRKIVYSEDNPESHHVEIPPNEVPEWEWECPCRFTLFVIHQAGGTHKLAFERLFKDDDFKPQRWSREEHDRMVQEAKESE